MTARRIARFVRVATLLFLATTTASVLAAQALRGGTLEETVAPGNNFDYPYEDHSVGTYASDLDMWARWVAWFDIYVKNPKSEQKTIP